VSGSVGYQSNRNVRTRSNGRRASHGYNYRHLIQYCAGLNRDEAEHPRNRRALEMFASVIEAFEAARKTKVNPTEGNA